MKPVHFKFKIARLLISAFRVSALMAVCATLMVAPKEARACSAFCLMQPNDAGPLVAKNFDWIPFHDYGDVFVNKRGVFKRAQTQRTDHAAEWTSKYGSVTFSQVGIEFPVSGINEAGLSADILQLPEASYHDEKDPRPAVNESQWLQYQLDNYGTLQDVIANAESLRIEKAFIGVHYFICDPTGACGVFEFINGKLYTHTGVNLTPTILTNSIYEDSVADFKGESATHKREYDAELAQANMSGFVRMFASAPRSFKRFATAAAALTAQAVAATKAVSTDYAFDVLEKLRVAHVLRTQWSFVYDLKNRKVTFRTKANPSSKTLSLSDLDFSCAKPNLVADLQQAEGGDVKSRLQPLTPALNEELVNKNWLLLARSTRKLAAAYPGAQTHCVRP